MRYNYKLYGGGILPVEAYGTVDNVPYGVVFLNNGVLYKSVHCFSNFGNDYVDLGRSNAALIDLLSPSNTYTIKVVAKRTYDDQDVLLAIGNSSSAQVLMGHYTENKVAAIVGGTYYEMLTTGVNQLGFTRYELRNSPTTYRIVAGSVTSTNVNHGVITSDLDLVIGGRSDGSHGYEGDILYVAFYDASNVLVDCVDFTKLEYWDGGAYGVTIKGEAFQITDGAPFSVHGKTAVPLSMLDY